MSEISKDAQIALNDLGSYSILFGASRIAEEAKEFLVAHIASLEAQLAATQARLAAFEEGYDPMVELPKDFEVVIIDAKHDTKVSRLYPASMYVEHLCFEDPFGKQDEIKNVNRWFPLPGTKEEE